MEEVLGLLCGPANPEPNVAACPSNIAPPWGQGGE